MTMRSPSSIQILWVSLPGMFQGGFQWATCMKYLTQMSALSKKESDKMRHNLEIDTKLYHRGFCLNRQPLLT